MRCDARVCRALFARYSVTKIVARMKSGPGELGNVYWVEVCNVRDESLRSFRAALSDSWAAEPLDGMISCE